MMKVISVICAIGVIALGVTDVALTCTGHLMPRPLNYLLWALCVINAGFLAKYARQKN